MVYTRTKHIITDYAHYSTNNAKIVSLAPELSLAAIGDTIPVIEVAKDLPYPTLHEMAYILTMIGHMVMNCSVPKHTIEALGDVTNTIPNMYAKGREALAYCSQNIGQ